MISKVEGKELRNEAVIAARPKLSPLERGMLNWAVVDPGDKVLDANARDGLMLEYLHRNMECEICGISSVMESVKQTRCQLQNADIVFAHAQDIPWRANTFDAVFLRRDKEYWQDALLETLRVLKPGGQFLMGTTCFPAPLRQVANFFTQDDDAVGDVYQSRADMVKTLQNAGYQQVSWHRVNLTSGVIIGWKPMEGELEEDEQKDCKAS